MNDRVSWVWAVAVLVAATCGCVQVPHDTLVYGRGGDSVGLDPALESDGESYKVCDSLYDTLVAYAEGSTEIMPALATYWSVSEDGLSWTFHLRSGVRFHDGTPFDAHAVVFALERQFTREKYPPVRGSFLYWEAMGMSGIVRDVKAMNDSTVVFGLYEAHAPFLANLAMNFCAIPSPTAVRTHGDAYFKHPVGTGPFRLAEWVKDDRIVLERNPDYWGQTPPLRRVVFRSIPDNTTRLLELLGGAIDVMDGVSPDFAAEIAGREDLKLLSAPGMNVAYLAMNCTRPPFDDPRVRRAINHAINRDALVETLYGGKARVAAGPLPPTVWSASDAITPYRYDPVEARRLLAEAGMAEGFAARLWSMTVPRPYMPQPERVAQVIQADLTSIGVRAEVTTYEWGTYLDKVSRGEHEMALLGWTGDNGDPDNFLYVLLSGRAAEVPAQNIAFYRNPALDRLLSQARHLTDRAQRSDLYRQAQAFIHLDAPWVPIVHAEQLMAMRREIVGLNLHPTGKIRLHRTRRGAP